MKHDSTQIYGLICLLCIWVTDLRAQTVSLRGQVIESGTRQPLPACNIYLKNHPSIGTTTDLEGRFELKFQLVRDTLVVDFIGYEPAIYPIDHAVSRHDLLFELQPTGVMLSEVFIRPGENPAYRIIREAVRRKNLHNPRQLNNYTCQAYYRLEGYVRSNDKMVSRLRFVRDMKQVAARYDQLRTTEGDTLIPVMVNETLMQLYISNNPAKRREDILAQSLSGIGLEDAPVLQNILSNGSFFDYNFYNNQINILTKYFPSPLANGWRITYDFELEDSLVVDGSMCYQLQVIPLHKGDLAFAGHIWITQDEFALKKVKLRITSNANINFVRSLAIEQILAPSETGVWLPKSTSFQAELAEFTDLIPAIWLHSYAQYSQYKVNQSYPAGFYEIREPLTASQQLQASRLAPYRQQQALNDSLHTRLSVHHIIDTLNRIPSVRGYVGTLRVLTTGYLRTRYIDFGHYARYYAWNDIEGHRIGFGFRTNYHLSERWMFKNYIAYGSQDQRWKFDLRLFHVLTRKRFTLLGLQYFSDIEPLIFLDQRGDLPELFIASNRFLGLAERRPFFRTTHALWVDSRLSQWIRLSLRFQQNQLEALFPFAYYRQPSDVQPQERYLQTTELIAQLRIQRAMRLTRDANLDEIDLANRNPRLTIWAVAGFQGLLGGDFTYQKVYAELAQKNANILGIGHANYSLTAGYIFQDLPYPLLRTHLGNNTPILIERSFNLMNGFEFISDHFIALHYAHYFEGFFFNKIPFIRSLNDKLEWRLVGSLNVVWGGIRENTLRLIAEQTASGQPVQSFSRLYFHKPYVEAGYGIDNIFRFFRIDFFYRFTYLDSPQAQPWAVKVSAEIKF